jgi:hypothetical protein
VRERPRLASEVAQVAHAQGDLFEHLAMHRVLGRLAGFEKTCERTEAAGATHAPLARQRFHGAAGGAAEAIWKARPATASRCSSNAPNSERFVQRHAERDASRIRFPTRPSVP